MTDPETAIGDNLNTSSERAIAILGRRVPLQYLLALLAAGAAWLFIVLWCDPYGRWPGTAMDAHAYYLALVGTDPYSIAAVGTPNAYLYSPIFLQLLWPLQFVSWQGFVAAWAVFPLAALAYLTGPRLFVLGLVLTLAEVAGGNIELLIGVAIVVGFRWPAAWSFVLLTKVTPGLGLLWFVVRREWRSLFIALGATVAVMAVSFAVWPDAWIRWPQVLTSNTGATKGTWAAVPIPFMFRLPFAVLLIIWGARTNHRWTVPIAAMLALPALWYGGLAIIIATFPLVGAKTWTELRQVLVEGWREMIVSVKAVPGRLNSRRTAE
ncbi:MAG TPA: glycosyltransferase family 87 protein [Candidatus Limnocylindrales bacterium]